MKKNLSVLLVLILSIGLLVGCGTNAEVKEKTIEDYANGIQCTNGVFDIKPQLFAEIIDSINPEDIFEYNGKEDLSKYKIGKLKYKKFKTYDNESKSTIKKMKKNGVKNETIRTYSKTLDEKYGLEIIFYGNKKGQCEFMGVKLALFDIDDKFNTDRFYIYQPLIFASIVGLNNFDKYSQEYFDMIKHFNNMKIKYDKDNLPNGHSEYTINNVRYSMDYSIGQCFFYATPITK